MEVFCLNTTQLECFLSVANFLNFSRAAEQLRITQPAVSHQISSLEDELGTKLFWRTSKSVRLTQEGYLFTQYASEILRLSGLSKTRLREYQEAQPMRLGIGCRSSDELRLLRPVLTQLRQERPELLPVLRLIPFDSLENLLEEGDIQVMFSFQESAPKKGVYQELAQCPAVCMCAESHPLAEEQTLTVEQLKQAGRIAVCRPPNCPPALFHLQSGVVAGRAPNQLLFCDNQEAAYTMVSAGYAYTVTVDFPQIRLPGLRYIPLPELEPLSFGASYLPGNRSPVLRRFLSLLEENLSPSLPAE